MAGQTLCRGHHFGREDFLDVYEYLSIDLLRNYLSIHVEDIDILNRTYCMYLTCAKSNYIYIYIKICYIDVLYSSICIYIYLLNLFTVVKCYVFICRFTHVNKDVGKTVSNCIHIRKHFI